MFKLEITSVEELIIFIKIVKGEDPNDELLKSLSKQIDESDEKLKNAVEQSKGA